MSKRFRGAHILSYDFTPSRQSLKSCCWLCHLGTSFRILSYNRVTFLSRTDSLLTSFNAILQTKPVFFVKSNPFNFNKTSNSPHLTEKLASLRHPEVNVCRTSIYVCSKHGTGPQRGTWPPWASPAWGRAPSHRSLGSWTCCKSPAKPIGTRKTPGKNERTTYANLHKIGRCWIVRSVAFNL